jgi:NADH:ubiquinone oxidoreductase subunit 6 (subunit J)
MGECGMNEIAASPGVIISVFLVGEIVALFVFYFMSNRYLKLDKRMFAKERIKPMLMGLLERVVLLWCLLIGLPQIIIAFSALKLGTRLDKEKRIEIKTEYFLVGTLTSLLITVADLTVINTLT